MPKKRSKQAKKCSECGKILGSHNKSGFCTFHYIVAWKKNPKNRERLNSQKRRYYAKNKEKLRKKAREYQSRKKLQTPKIVTTS